MQNDEKLKIALKALLELKNEVRNEWAYRPTEIIEKALRDIRREHYLNAPSPVVADLIGAQKL